MVGKYAQIPPKTQFFKTGPGCNSCVAGIAGRIPVFELFVTDSKCSELIDQRASKEEILRTARKTGMTNLSEEIIMRVLAGYVDLNAVTAYLV